MAQGLSCCAACGIFPKKRSNARSLHWQADSHPPGSPQRRFLRRHKLSQCHHPPDAVTFSPLSSCPFPPPVLALTGVTGRASRRKRMPFLVWEDAWPREGAHRWSYLSGLLQGQAVQELVQSGGSRCPGRKDTCVQASKAVESLPGERDGNTFGTKGLT